MEAVHDGSQHREDGRLGNAAIAKRGLVPRVSFSTAALARLGTTGNIRHCKVSTIVVIPSNVISRDVVLDANETLTTSYCRVAPSNQHCLAVYTTVGGDGKESRSIVILYDANWSRVGTTGRNPRSWAQNGGVYVGPFRIEHLVNVDGWDIPIFVTSAFAREPPCTEFRIHTFLPDGRFATIRVPNRVVADDGRRGICTW